MSCAVPCYVPISYLAAALLRSLSSAVPQTTSQTAHVRWIFACLACERDWNGCAFSRFLACAHMRIESCDEPRRVALAWGRPCAAGENEERGAGRSFHKPCQCSPVASIFVLRALDLINRRLMVLCKLTAMWVVIKRAVLRFGAHGRHALKNGLTKPLQDSANGGLI